MDTANFITNSLRCFPAKTELMFPKVLTLTHVRTCAGSAAILFIFSDILKFGKARERWCAFFWIIPKFFDLKNFSILFFSECFLFWTAGYDKIKVHLFLSHFTPHKQPSCPSLKHLKSTINIHFFLVISMLFIVYCITFECSLKGVIFCILYFYSEMLRRDKSY